jgi:PAS domain S-box-containing protein
MKSRLSKLRPATRAFVYAFLFLVLTSPYARGQGRVVDFEHVTIEDGLSEGAVTTILQDHRGFLWFATQDGLNRYDGHSFLVFRNDPADTTSLSDNYISSLCVDHTGRLWIGTQQGGLDLLKKDNRSFERFGRRIADSSSGDKAYISSIVEDPNGVLWIGTLGNGIIRMDPATGSIQRFMHSNSIPGSLSHNSVWALHIDRAGTLWAGTYDGLNRYNARRGRFEIFRIPGGSPSPALSNINAIAEDNKGNLWCVAWKSGLFLFNQEVEALVQVRSGKSSVEINKRVLSIVAGRDGSIWLATASDGLQQLSGARVESYRNDPNDLRSISSNQVMSLFMDRSGVLWIGTNGGGINKLNSANRPFEHYRHLIGDPNSLSANSVWAFHEDRQGNLWVGTIGGGLDRIDRSTQRVTHYGGEHSAAPGLTSTMITAIHEDRKGTLWVGSQDAGLFRFDRTRNSFTRLAHNPSDPKSLGTDIVNCIYEDDHGTLWIGTYGGGLNRMDSGTGRFTRFVNDPANPRGIGGNTVIALHGARDGGMWIATFTGGVDKYKDGVFTHYRNDPSNPHSLNNDRIESLYEDPSGVLWVGTWGGGLNRLDVSSGTFTHFTQKDGLPNSTIYGILADAQGNLWMSTNKGIAKFAVSADTFRCYDVRDGLQHNEFNQGAYLKLRSGEFLFGGVNGYNRFHPDSVRINVATPPVVLTSFKVSGADTPLDLDLGFTDRLELSHDQNFFSIGFAALDFTNPSRVRYAYMIEGYDKTWVQAGNQHSAIYTSVDPGTHTFRVIACNSDGVWNSEGATLTIVINPPFWKTWWAYTLYCLAGLLTIVGIIRQRTKTHEELSKEQQAKLEEGARQLAHERFISHSLRQAEEKLALSEKRLRQIIDLIPHFIFAKERSGKFILANKAVADAFGTTVDALTGRTDAEFSASQAEVRRFRDDDTQVLESGLPKDIPEETLTDAAGKTRVLHTKKIPFTFSGASSASVLGISVDITERKQAEEALRKSEHDFRHLFDSANDVIVILDPEQEIILEANAAACATYGFDRDVLVGMSLKTLTTDVGKGEAQINSTLQAGSCRDFESIHINSKGEHIHFLINSSVIDYRSKKAILSINRDITERRQAEEALRQGQKLKSIGTLAGGIAHDFNNLLNAVLGQSALALNKLPKESPAGSNITKAIKAAERAADLTRQLLAYSGKGKMVSEDIDLNLLVKENVQMLEVSVPKTARLQFELGSPSPHIRGDVGQIQQIVMNLIINAGEAMGPSPGFITLRTGQVQLSQDDAEFWKYTNAVLAPGRYALLQVSDSGQGMKPEVLARIFDPFFTTKFTGRGLGLAAVLGIIRGHQGGVRITSAEGKGTQFEVVFPMLEFSVVSGVPESNILPLVRGDGQTILVIDDEASVLELLTDILTEAKFRVIGALNPVEGIELYRRHKQDISMVVLDYSMPGMDGKAAFEELVIINPVVRVLLCSGYSEEETASVFGNVRPAGFISKPYHPEVLLEKISMILRP